MMTSNIENVGSSEPYGFTVIDTNPQKEQIQLRLIEIANLCNHIINMEPGKYLEISPTTAFDYPIVSPNPIKYEVKDLQHRYLGFTIRNNTLVEKNIELLAKKVRENLDFLQTHHSEDVKTTAEHFKPTFDEQIKQYESPEHYHLVCDRLGMIDQRSRCERSKELFVPNHEKTARDFFNLISDVKSAIRQIIQTPVITSSEAGTSSLQRIRKTAAEKEQQAQDDLNTIFEGRKELASPVQKEISDDAKRFGDTLSKINRLNLLEKEFSELIDGTVLSEELKSRFTALIDESKDALLDTILEPQDSPSFHPMNFCSSSERDSRLHTSPSPPPPPPPPSPPPSPVAIPGPVVIDGSMLLNKISSLTKAEKQAKEPDNDIVATLSLALDSIRPFLDDSNHETTGYWSE